MNILKEVLITIFLFACVYVGIERLYGETVVTATVNGKPVKSQVSINGEYVGETPYKAHLGYGHFEISVLPPDGVNTTITEYTYDMLTLVLGAEVKAAFKRE